MIKCDLHIHTNYSDGALSPGEVMRRLSAMGVQAAAITDHDTIDGIREGREAAERYGLKYADGMEFSTFDESLGEIHILGYAFDLTDGFIEGLEQAKRLRRERIKRMFDNLEREGISFSDEEKDKAKGRVDIAFMLRKAKYVGYINEAFDVYLGKNGKAYVEAGRLEPSVAVKMIKEAGGVAVLAHPWRFADEMSLCPLVERLKAFGLGGIEVYYPSHTPEMRKELALTAERYDLIKTGGSDFHMDSSSVRLGDGNAVLDERAEKIIFRK